MPFCAAGSREIPPTARGQARSDFIFREYFAFAAVVEGEKALRRLERAERLSELRREALHGVRDTFFAQNILRTPRRVLAEAYLSRTEAVMRIVPLDEENSPAALLFRDA